MSRSESDSSSVKPFDLTQAALKAFRNSLRAWPFALAFCLTAAGPGFSGSAAATPAIVIDAASGSVLYAHEATQPWFPASLTKLMTFYVALQAVQEHKISLDTPIMMSARAARAVPSKMGFRPGTELTLGNALKMMVVKSANDLAIAIAEAVDGSVEAFADDMNATAARLGMRQSHFVNPNGLADPEHFSSAHDLALLARAIHVNFPQEAGWFGIGALRLGDEIIPNHNNLLGRYPGVDGMKTGFTCAAGFNLIATARRDGHRYIAVVLGAPNPRSRMMRTAVLLDRAFDGIDHPQTTLQALDAEGAGTPPDMHNQVCRRRGKALAAFVGETARLEAPLLARKTIGAPVGLPFGNGGAGAAELTPVAPIIASMHRPVFDPLPVSIGAPAGYQGPVAAARPANSPIGTPSPPTVAASPAEESKPSAVAAADARPARVHHHAARHHAGHKKIAHNRARGKAAHRSKEKAIIVENKADTRAGKTEHEKKKIVAHVEKRTAPGKHHAAKKTHVAKHVKKAAPKKHLAKHVAARPLRLEGGKAETTKTSGR